MWSIYSTSQYNTDVVIYLLYLSYTLMLYLSTLLLAIHWCCDLSTLHLSYKVMWSIYFTSQLNTDAVIYLLYPSAILWCYDLSTLPLTLTLMLWSIFLTPQLNTDVEIDLLCICQLNISQILILSSVYCTSQLNIVRWSTLPLSFILILWSIYFTSQLNMNVLI